MLDGRRAAIAVSAAAILVATALFRFLELRGFPNDQFEHLAGAQQILMGEWPNRDFFDPGMPLTYLTSAVAQLLLGRTLFAEAILTSVAFGVAAAITMIGATRLSRSLLVGIVAAVFCVAIFPRPYTYPKALVCAVGPLVMWAWLARPSLARTIGLAFTSVVAFLFRYDYGVYLGAAAVLTTLLAPAESWRPRVARAAKLCLLIAIMLSPYALYIQATEGMATAVAGVLEYGARHADRTKLDFFNLTWGPELALFYGFHALPMIALIWCGIERLRRRPIDAEVVLPLALLTILVNVGFLRDPLSARLPDAVVPVTFVGAWLSGRAAALSTRIVRVTAVACAAMLAALGANAVIGAANLSEHVIRTRLTGREDIVRLLERKTGELVDRFSRQQIPDARVIPLFPLFEYVGRCTTTAHRLLVTSYAPELYVYSQRMFAGGQKVFMEGYQNGPRDQQRTIDRMKRQTTLLVIAPSDVYEEWQRGFAQVNAYVRTEFRPLADIPISDERAWHVLINQGLPPVRTDAQTGWPCYR